MLSAILEVANGDEEKTWSVHSKCSGAFMLLDLIRNLRDVIHDMRLEDHKDTGTYRD